MLYHSFLQTDKILLRLIRSQHQKILPMLLPSYFLPLLQNPVYYESTQSMTSYLLLILWLMLFFLLWTQKMEYGRFQENGGLILLQKYQPTPGQTLLNGGLYLKQYPSLAIPAPALLKFLVYKA